MSRRSQIEQFTRTDASIQDLGLLPTLDLMIIWGHGFNVEDEILAMAQEQGFSIKACFRRKLKSMSRTISRVYSDDYAPIHHLRAKTAYLKTVTPELLLVPMINWRPSLNLVGKGDFRHVESQRVRHLKDSVRDQFNPRKSRHSQERSENHVMHCTDNRTQAERLLRSFGEDAFLSNVWPKPRDVPPRWTPSRGPLAKLTVAIEDLLVGQVRGSRWDYCVERLRVKDSVAFNALRGDWDSYSLYMRTFRGTAICGFHNKMKFQELEQRLIPKLRDGCDLGIHVRLDNERALTVVDGSHRLALLAHYGLSQAVVSMHSQEEVLRE